MQLIPTPKLSAFWQQPPTHPPTLAATVLLAMAISGGQVTAADADSAKWGLEIRSGQVSYPANQNVLARDLDGNQVIAKVHLQIDGTFVLLFPDGQLATQPVDNTQSTSKPFVAVDKKTLARKVLASLPSENGWKTRSTRHYVFAYNTTAEFALATSRILETMLPGIRKFSENQKIPTTKPIVPMALIMFATEHEFQAYRPVGRGVRAYYEPVSNRVVLYQGQRTSPDLKPKLALQQSISTIAHEGVHQILHNIGVQQRLSYWPMWISEGLAEYFAPTSIGKRMRWKGLGQINDLRIFELEQLLKSQPTEVAGKLLIEPTVTANRLSSNGYASAWAITHFLAQRRKSQFRGYLQAVSQLKPLQGIPYSNDREPSFEHLALFQAHFGENLNRLESALIQHLRQLPYNDPYAEFPHLVGMVIYRDGRQLKRIANVFHTREVANKWTSETLERLQEPSRSTARYSLRSFPNRAVAERFVDRWIKAR
ncbi:MAG: DUF1570 domain-containing protein [Planctomycetota bacterium]|nr:DUF1570 domain-containing protein [Planctomycetota bacterium]